MSNIVESPLSEGKILDKSVTFVFQNLALTTLVGLLIYLPQFIFETWVFYTKSNDSYGIIKYKLIMIFINAFIMPFLAGLIAILLNEQLCGRKTTLSLTIKKCIGKWWSLILLSFFMNSVMLLGFALFIIPGFIVMFATVCAIPAMMIEDLKPMKAFKRSWNLTQKNRLRIFGFFPLPIILGIMAGSISPKMVNYIYQLCIFVIVPLQALWQAISAHLFFELRNRKNAVELKEEEKTFLVELTKMS